MSEKDLVKVTVSYQGEIHAFESPMAIVAVKMPEGVQVGVMGSATTKDLVSIGASVDNAITEAIVKNSPISRILEDIVGNLDEFECDRDCDNCRQGEKQAW